LGEQKGEYGFYLYMVDLSTRETQLISENYCWVFFDHVTWGPSNIDQTP
jgi:hypothetical protein